MKSWGKEKFVKFFTQTQSKRFWDENFGCAPCVRKTKAFRFVLLGQNTEKRMNIIERQFDCIVVSSSAGF